MSESAQREWRFYLDDMIGFAEKVIAYTHGLDQDGFVASGLNYDATVRNLELIGEAATHFPHAIHQSNHPIGSLRILTSRAVIVTAAPSASASTIRGHTLSKSDASMIPLRPSWRTRIIAGYVSPPNASSA